MWHVHATAISHYEIRITRQLALEPLWRAYEACAPGADTRAVLERIVKGLGLGQARLPLPSLPYCSYQGFYTLPYPALPYSFCTIPY